MAAAQLGYRCHVYAPEAGSIAPEVCGGFTCAAWDDAEALARFAADCAVITYEFENVPVAPLAAIGGTPLLPHPRALETAQDRLVEKQFAESLGGRPADYAAVDSAEDLVEAIARLGAPGILKTRREGYDGKGQWRIASEAEARALHLPPKPLAGHRCCRTRAPSKPRRTGCLRNGSRKVSAGVRPTTRQSIQRKIS
ncbi:MAG TPA: ATP-grasp domain-containing protein, partial [Woeseiaceae bacterium]|nr:ATP-grasp domain-containing protein [Woeseiaceae bacterium]